MGTFSALSLKVIEFGVVLVGKGVKGHKRQGKWETL